MLGREPEVVLFCLELPTQDRLLSGPGGVHLAEILCRGRILTESVCGLVGTEDCVDPSKKVEENLASFLGAALAGLDKIVQVEAYLGQGVRLMLGGGLHPLFIISLLGRPICQ